MAKAIHSMIRVLDEDRSVAFYRRAFGLEIADRFGFDDFTLVYLRNDDIDFEIELTVNHGQTEPYTHGSGYGHLAVAVGDLPGEHKRFTELGLEPTPWEWERFVLGHASVARLKAFPLGGTHIFSMRSFNDMEHLPDDLRSR